MPVVIPKLPGGDKNLLEEYVFGKKQEKPCEKVKEIERQAKREK